MQHRKNTRWREQGRCVQCGGEAVTPGTKICLQHWLDSVASRTAHNRELGKDGTLWKIWQAQGGRCALTGAVLTPARGAALDHILPRSRGGTNDPSNLQWITNEVNDSKSYHTEEEFLDLCRLVLAHHEQKTKHLTS